MGRGFIYEAVDPFTHQVKLRDPGSAKVPVKGDEKISYICSHYYRAPGLIFGATEYIQHPSISAIASGRECSGPPYREYEGSWQSN
ncbi:hypothetical protein ACFX1R_027264 [Malus domestica]